LSYAIFWNNWMLLARGWLVGIGEHREVSCIS
jgi:hypothetical protein